MGLKDFSANYHQYITFEIIDAICQCASVRDSPSAMVDIGKFVEVLRADRIKLEGALQDVSVAADTAVSSVVNLVTMTCGAFMLQRAASLHEPSMH